jgi:hypothetical protein
MSALFDERSAGSFVSSRLGRQGAFRYNLPQED